MKPKKPHDYILFHFGKILLASCARSILRVLSEKEYL